MLTSTIHACMQDDGSCVACAWTENNDDGDSSILATRRVAFEPRREDLPSFPPLSLPPPQLQLGQAIFSESVQPELKGKGSLVFVQSGVQSPGLRGTGRIFLVQICRAGS
jgi:hypothetical protein